MLIGDLSGDQLYEWNILWEEVTILYPALGYYLKFRQGLMYILRTTISIRLPLPAYAYQGLSSDTRATTLYRELVMYPLST